MSSHLEWKTLRAIAKIRPEKRPDGTFIARLDDPPLTVEAASLVELEKKLGEQLKALLEREPNAAAAAASEATSDPGVHLQGRQSKLSWDIKDRPGGGYVATCADPPMTLEADTREELDRQMMQKFTEITGVKIPEPPALFKGGVHVSSQVKTKFNVGSSSSSVGPSSSSGTLPEEIGSSSGNPVVITPESKFPVQAVFGILAVIALLVLLWLKFHGR